MSKSTHVLKIQKGSKVYTCDLYTTMAEARKELYPNLPLFRVQIGSQTLYAPFTTTLNSATESTPLVCPLFAADGNDTLYCVAQHAFYKVNITPVANAKITVIAYENVWNGKYYELVEITRWNSGAKWFPFGTELDISVSGNPANIWMSPGLVITPNTDVTLVNKNKEITATAPTRWTYEFTLAGTEHQTITVKYTQPGKSQVTKTSTSTGQYIKVLAGTTWTATVAGATGYNPGSLSNGSGTITDNQTVISATAAKLKTFTLKLAATTHQTITLKYKNHKSDGTVAAEVTKTSTSSAQSFTVGYGTTWTATLAAATGYTKGTLSASSGTVKAATTVSATAATAITPKITFTWTADGWTPTATITYTNSSGTSKTATKPSSVTIKYNTAVKITDTKNSNPYYLKITQGSTYKTAIHTKESWTSGKLTANTTFKIVGFYEGDSGSGGEGSGGEGGA